MTKAAYKSKCLIGIMAHRVGVHDGRAKVWQWEQLRAHILIHKQETERKRHTGNRVSLLKPLSLPLVTHLLQQGHTS